MLIILLFPLLSSGQFSESALLKAQANASVVGFSTATSGLGHSTNITISGTNNLTATISTINKQGMAYLNTSKTSGKWYGESTITYVGSYTNYYTFNGAINALVSLGTLVGDAASGWAFGFDGTVAFQKAKYHAASEVSYGVANVVTTTTICYAWDLDNLFFYSGVVIAGVPTWNGGGVPTSGALGTNATYPLTAGAGGIMYFASSLGTITGATSISVTLNSGTTTVGTPPIGYSTLTI